MSDAIESLIVEPILQSDVLFLDERTRAFFRRAGHEFPADAEWLFRPLHPGDYAGGLMYDTKGRKMEAGFGYTVVDGMLAIDEHVSFPLEFAYMLEVQIDGTSPAINWPIPGTQPGQGWSIQPPPNTAGPNGGTWTWPGSPTPIGPVWTVGGSTPDGVYYGSVVNQGVAQHGHTLNVMNASSDMTITAYSSGPTSITDFAAIRASGATVTGVGT